MPISRTRSLAPADLDVDGVAVDDVNDDADAGRFACRRRRPASADDGQPDGEHDGGGRVHRRRPTGVVRTRSFCEVQSAGNGRLQTTVRMRQHAEGGFVAPLMDRVITVQDLLTLEAAVRTDRAGRR